MKRTLTIFILFALTHWVQAQHCDIPSGLDEIASLDAQGDFPEALEKTEQLLQCVGISDKEAIALHLWQFKMYRNGYREKNANRAILRAKSIWEETGEPFNFNFRLLLLESSALRGDTAVYEPMLRQFRDELFSKNENDYHEYLGRYYFLINYKGNDAIPNFLKALSHFEKLEHPPVFHMGVTLRGLGNMNRNRGDFEKSLAYYDQERQLYEANFPEDHFNISICNFNLGNVYYETLEYQKALSHYLKVVPVWEERYEPDHFRMKTLHEAIGDMYWELGDQKNALSYFERATENEALINNDSSELTISSADSLLQKGNYADAISYYKEAVLWREKTYGKQHSMTGACKNFVARAIRSSGDIDGSLNMYQEAIGIFVPEMDQNHWTANPTEEMKVSSLIYLLEALTAKGELLQDKFLETQEVKYLEGALHTQEVAIGVLERIKNTQISEGSKLFWTTRTRSLIESSIETAVSLATLKEDKTYLETAFNFSEKSKALLLLSSLFDQESISFSRVPNEIIEQEKYLKGRINEYRGKINNEEKRCGQVRASLLSLFKGELKSTQEEYDLFLDRVKNEYPEYYGLKFDPEIASVSEIQQQLLDDDTQLLSYFTGNNAIIVFAISKNGVTVRSIQDPDQHITAASALFENISAPVERAKNPQESYEEFSRLAHELYNTLIAPELKANALKRLIIIPDGSLAYLPFEMLLTQPAPAARNYKTLSYLLKDQAISYSQSASIRILAENLDGTHSTYMGFAPSYEASNSNGIRQGLSSLKHNTSEVNYAKNLFGGNSWVGNSVSEELLKQHSAKAGILHLAMHGEVEDEHPLLSKLYFNPSEAEDGLLHTYEIYNLNIPSQLVILSACNTATGKLESGEGILSLERAFQYAGSKSLLSTLWTVDDAASAEITQYFLAHLDLGKPKDIALQEAKLQFIDNASPEKLAPFYWSSFKLTGTTQVFSEEHHLWYIWPIAGVIFAIFLVLFYRRKQRTN